MFVYPNAQILDVTGPLEVFGRTARWLCDRWGFRIPAYTVELIAATAGPVRMSNGLQLIASKSCEDEVDAQTFLVAGGAGYAEVCKNPALLAWVARTVQKPERSGSVCTGALVLAAAGLLDGRRATTHWAYFDELKGLTPTCEIDREAVFTRSGRIYTSAGVTSGIDLALEFVEQDWGRQTAIAVAQELLVYRRRTSNHAQVSPYIEAERRHDKFGQLLLWVLDHLAEDLSVERLATVVSMSPRHFSRQFRAFVGMTPAEYVQKIRLEEACRRIDYGAARLKDVARQCGFADEQNLRRAFLRKFGMAPSEYSAREEPPPLGGAQNHAEIGP